MVVRTEGPKLSSENPQLPGPSIPGAPSPARPKKRWWLLAGLVLFGGCCGLSGWFFGGGVMKAQRVTAAELPTVEGVMRPWSLDALVAAGVPGFRQALPAGVAEAYFADWSSRLGPVQTLTVAGFRFDSHAGQPTIVTGTYHGVFERGTATVVVEFSESAGAWPVRGFNVVDIVSTSAAPTSAPAGE